MYTLGWLASRAICTIEGERLETWRRQWVLNGLSGLVALSNNDRLTRPSIAAGGAVIYGAGDDCLGLSRKSVITGDSYGYVVVAGGIRSRNRVGLPRPVGAVWIAHLVVS